MASTNYFNNFFPIRWFSLINGQTLNNLFNQMRGSVEDGITAHAGGTKAAAYILRSTISRISVAASSSDSVMLATPAYVGEVRQVINDGANSIQIFGQNSDTIDGVATATGVALTNADRAFFTCTGVTLASPNPIYAWRSQLGTKSS